MRRLMLLYFLFFAQTVFAQDSAADSLLSANAARLTELPYVEEDVRRKEQAIRKAAIENERKESLISMLIALGAVVLIRFYLLFVPGFIRHVMLINLFGLMALLLLFQSLYLWLQPLWEDSTPRSPVWIPAWMGIVALLALGHYRMEKWLTRKMLQKNKRLRLMAAKKSIGVTEERKALGQN